MLVPETAPGRRGRFAPARVLLRRLAGFGTLSFLGSASALLVLPLLARRAGPGGWVAFGSGQAIGSLAAAVVMLGWNVVGQAEVAVATGAGRPAVYARSLRVRLPLACVAAPVAGVLAALLSPQDRTLAAAMAVATALTGLAVGWFCIGEGSVVRLFAFEAGPKLAAAAASAGALAVGASPVVYPIALAGVQLAAVAVFSARVLRGSRERIIVPAGRWTRDVAVAWHGGLSALVGTATSVLPVPLAAQLVGGSGAAGFVSADRLYRYALLVVVGLGNALSAWSVGSDRRIQIGRVLHLLLGVLGAAGLVLLGPTVSHLLFGDEVRADPGVLAWQGVAFLALGVSTPLVRMVLGFAGRWGPVLVATLVGAVVATAAMVVGGLVAQGAGVAFGLAAGEVACAATLLIVRRATRARRVRTVGGHEL